MINEKVEKFLKEHSILLGIIAIYIIFHSLFEQFISELVVVPFLSKVGSEILNDIVFLLIFLIIAIFFILKRHKNYKVNTYTFVQSLVVLLLFLYYRVGNHVWEFTELSILKAVKYIDVVATYFIFNTLLFFFHRQKRSNNSQIKGFYLDSSLGKTLPDLLNREALARYIYTEIKETDSPDSSFAIGISSEWGFGKTSFLDLIERNIESNSNIILKINPWINHDSKSIVKDFFAALSVKLSDYNSDISLSINRYADLLIGIEDSNLSKILNPIQKYFSQDSTVVAEFEQINKAIKNLDKKLIIFIDDLDRLYKEEIIQVVKLIRNSANFGNTVFIVAYDRNYVVNALKEINNYCPEFFLEKIFQLEVNLPNFESQVIQKRIYELLSPRLLDKDKIELTKIFQNYKNPLDPYVFSSGSLSTLRDATRFSNSFLLAYSILKEEIVLVDLLNLEVLRLKYPGVYKLIFYNSEKFLNPVSNKYNKTQYILRKEGEKDDKNEENLIIRKYLLNNNDRVGISISEIDSVINLLHSLFPNVDNLYIGRNSDLLSVSNPSSFERYSFYRLLDSNLSEKEFSLYRSKSLEEFTTKIRYWIKTGLRRELLKRFEDIKAYSDKEDFQKIINAIFYFARFPKIGSIESDFSGFEFSNLFQKLDKVKEYLRLNYFSSQNEYKDFILDIFKNAPSPYVFEAEFIFNYFEKFSTTDSFIVSKKEFQEIRLEYLKKYIQYAKSFDSTVWHLYHYNDLIEAKPQGGGSFQIQKMKNPEATNLVIEFIRKKALDEFLLKIIKPQPFDEDGFAISEIIPQMFGDFSTFGDFIGEFNEKDYLYLKEFNDFYKQFKEVGFRRYILFEFKQMPVRKNK